MSAPREWRLDRRHCRQLRCAWSYTRRAHRRRAEMRSASLAHERMRGAAVDQQDERPLRVVAVDHELGRHARAFTRQGLVAEMVAGKDRYRVHECAGRFRTNGGKGADVRAMDGRRRRGDEVDTTNGDTEQS